MKCAKSPLKNSIYTCYGNYHKLTVFVNKKPIHTTPQNGRQGLISGENINKTNKTNIKFFFPFFLKKIPTQIQFIMIEFKKIY